MTRLTKVHDLSSILCCFSSGERNVTNVEFWNYSMHHTPILSYILYMLNKRHTLYFRVLRPLHSTYAYKQTSRWFRSTAKTRAYSIFFFFFNFHHDKYSLNIFHVNELHKNFDTQKNCTLHELST